VAARRASLDGVSNGMVHRTPDGKMSDPIEIATDVGRWQWRDVQAIVRIQGDPWDVDHLRGHGPARARHAGNGVLITNGRAITRVAGRFTNVSLVSSYELALMSALTDDEGRGWGDAADPVRALRDD